MRRNLILRAGVLLAGSAVAILAVAAPAAAHVTVNPNSATQGGYSKLTFRVPNEKATASTVMLEINLPLETPIASVSVRPVPGWTAEITKSKLTSPVQVHGREITEAATRIVWTAAPDAAINPGQFQEFDVSAGPLPEVDQIIFKALQTYSDGDVVRWIEEPKAGAEVEHPAPVLTLAKATAGSHDQAAVTVASQDADSGSSLGLPFAVAAVCLAAAALVAALLAYRRSTPPTGRPRLSE